ncbi:MAG: hypothetical protein H0T76_04560 [Nannocystis sp.]|nr:hypothetical protein [Nannocystis sp.]MBA3545735.1 hypothetical protein [Nannocystis sp.]
MTRAPILAAFVLAACGDTASPGFSTGQGITSVSATTSGSSSSGETSSTGVADDSAGSSGSSSTGVLRDVGAMVDFGPVQPPGCKGKVDLLFVISRQGTMQTEQTQLLASFPGFIDTIEQKLEGFDVHIMTANPDGRWPGEDVCETGSGLCKTYYPNCGPTAQDYQCGIYPDLKTKCDKVLGAGLTFNTGGGAANKLCDLQDGKRYIMSGEPDMLGAFECIAKVGASGGTAAMGDAMIAALSPALNQPDGCNAGFLRKDALLVVALITDFNDVGSKSYAKQQYEAIVAAKGDPGAVVMLAVVPNAPGEFEPAEKCDYEGGDSYGIFEDLLSRFPYKVFGDTCTPSFAPFFDQATGKISEACGSFIPQ